jgi:hypothetical protein
LNARPGLHGKAAIFLPAAAAVRPSLTERHPKSLIWIMDSHPYRAY